MRFFSFKSLLVAVFSGFFFLSAAPVLAGEPGHGEEGKEANVDVTKVILEHIRDDHSWHLWGHTTLPLPVILYSDKGLEVFSSTKLIDEHHEPAMYAGNYNYKTIEGKIKSGRCGWYG
jgi:F-type H+-transporting ATPase subunit a